MTTSSPALLLRAARTFSALGNLQATSQPSPILRCGALILIALSAPACANGEDKDQNQEEQVESGKEDRPSAEQAKPETSPASEKKPNSNIPEGQEPNKEPKKPEEPNKPVQDQPEWDYELGGDMGPELWGDLSPNYATCKSGSKQSPIDITKTKQDRKLATFKVDYSAAPYEAVDTGHTIQINLPPGQFITVGQERYELVQFHYHSGSEHTIQGKRYPMELQFVHKTEAGTVGMFGVLVKEGNRNKTLTTILENLPDPGKTLKKPKLSIDPSGVFPLSLQYFGYEGSMTIPPCTEGVKWHVLKTPITASPEQIEAFKKIYGSTHRPVQARNGRQVVTKYRL